MTTSEKRLLIGTMFVVLMVLSFLSGYAIAEEDWFRSIKSSILQMLGEDG